MRSAYTLDTCVIDRSHLLTQDKHRSDVSQLPYIIIWDLDPALKLSVVLQGDPVESQGALHLGQIHGNGRPTLIRGIQVQWYTGVENGNSNL